MPEIKVAVSKELRIKPSDNNVSDGSLNSGFISFYRLFNEGFDINKSLRSYEEIVGITIETNGITFHVGRKKL